jgi:N-sulfoglucosamine sulfohydrolase
MCAKLLASAFVLVAAIGLESPQVDGADTASRPNFIIMIADDVAWDDIGAYGHPLIRTPHIDRLAKDGLRFDLAFLTCSSCSPSRSSIMTGRYPHSTGAGELHQALPADQVVFAGLLKKAGYYTAAAGKWHLGKAAEVNFDKVVGGSPSGCELWLETLQQRPKDKPFFLWFASLDAHRGYSPNTIPQPHKPSDVVVPPYLPDAPETRRDLAMYYDEITRLDSYVGKVVAELETQGVADNTFVLFLSDNGRPFPRCKTTVYDSGVRTPFIVKWPAKVKAGSVSESLVSSVDIAPTILELAGVEPSPTFQGHSFAKLLGDPGASIRDYIFAEHNWHDYQAHERGVRSKQFLYIRNAFPHLTGSPPADAVRSPTYEAMQKLEAAGQLLPNQRGCFIAPRLPEELYDLEADPHSLSNLASNPAYAEALKQLSDELDRWIKRTGDSVPKNPTPDRFDRATGNPIK